VAGFFSFITPEHIMA
jgi:hypothetical protein